jgi:hypothetical protein
VTGAGPPLHRHDLGCPMLRDVRSMGTTDDGINRLFLSSPSTALRAGSPGLDSLSCLTYPGLTRVREN